MKTVSILTPCYNEEDNVEAVYRCVRSEFLGLAAYQYEHIFIDNNSTDRTLEILRGLAAADRNVKVIANARNFGHIRSPMHGFLAARGEAVIGIVADLQDPPELIPELLERWEQGFSMVLCIKRTTEERGAMAWLRRQYYRWIRQLSSIETFQDFTGFGLYDRKVVEAVRNFDDPYPYLRGLIADIGLPHCEVYYDQPLRKRGVTKHNWYVLYDIAILGVTNLSMVPLRVVTLLGFCCSALSGVVGALYLVYKLLFWSSFSVGVAPLVIGLFFLGSVQLLSLGILGEYIGSIQRFVRRQPYSRRAGASELRVSARCAQGE